MRITSCFDRDFKVGRFRILAATAVLMASPCAAFSQTEPITSAATVKVIDPMTVSPLIGPAPWNAGGPATHRMVVTHEKEGATYLDIGYNYYKKGVILAHPYAYDTDEACISPSGHMKLYDDDGGAELVPGTLMWRPAGGVTRSAEVLEDTVTICAMSPARLDATSYRVPPDAVGAWLGNPALKPMPKFSSMTSAPVITASDEPASPGVVRREALSMRRNGSARISATYMTMQAGSHFSTAPGKEQGNEQICYVLSGVLLLTTDQGHMSASTRSFIYRPAGARMIEAKASEDAKLVCFNSLPDL